MGKVGFGAYRVSHRSKEHATSLLDSLRFGCSLIDTSSNYTNGESEELIGNILSEHSEFHPQIVTKAGYIQGSNLKNLEELNSRGQAQEELVDLSDSLKHSIHPDFLRNQLDQSLKRLKRQSVDTFLLHNPEYYFQSTGATQDKYYERIQKAFEYLEEEVQKGRIKNYGISSNHFILPINNAEVTDLDKVLKAAKKVSSKNHFNVVQFPLNLIEIGALEKFGEYGDHSLIELAGLNNLTTLTNRPLNAFTNNQLVRLGTYEFMYQDFNEEKAKNDFHKCMKIAEDKYNREMQNESSEEFDSFFEITLIKQFSEMWNTLPTPDAVEQVYYGHFFPFIARIWGSDGLNAKESEPFYELLNHSMIYARKNMTEKANSFKAQAQNVGLISLDSEKSFSVEVIETYLNYGIDFVLLGMKNPIYVNEVKHLF